MIVIAWSPNGKILAARSDDWTVKLWMPPRANAGKLTGPYRLDLQRSVAWSPDGKTLAWSSGDTTLKL